MSRPAARHGPIGVFVAVLHTQRTFGELRRHAHQTGKDHPERRAWATNADGHRHTGDVTKPDRAGQRRCQRLEVADLACVIRVGIIPFDQRDRMGKGPELDQAEVNRKNRCCHNEPGNDPWETSSRERAEDQADKPACRVREYLVYLFINGLRECRSRGRHKRRGRQPE